MPLSYADRVQNALITSLEDNKSSFSDEVAKSTVLLAILKQKGRIKPYTGPLIKEKIMYGRTQGGSYQYYDHLNTSPADLFAEAEYLPTQIYASAVLSGREIVDNMGESQIIDVLDAAVTAAKATAREEVYRQMHGDGTGNGGLDLAGLKAMIPNVVNTGTYGGLNRATRDWWRPGSYDISNGDIPGYTLVTPTSIIPIMENVMIRHSAGTRGPDLALMSSSHYSALSAAFRERQMITSEGPNAKLGFNTLKVAVGGRTIEVALEGGIGSEMPAGTTYMLDTDSLALRYHPARNWTPSEKRAPTNQDAVVQYVWWQGALTANSMRHNAKFID